MLKIEVVLLDKVAKYKKHWDPWVINFFPPNFDSTLLLWVLVSTHHLHPNNACWKFQSPSGDTSLPLHPPFFSFLPQPVPPLYLYSPPTLSIFIHMSSSAQFRTKVLSYSPSFPVKLVGPYVVAAWSCRLNYSHTIHLPILLADSTILVCVMHAFCYFWQWSNVRSFLHLKLL